MRGPRCVKPQLVDDATTRFERRAAHRSREAARHARAAVGPLAVALKRGTVRTAATKRLSPLHIGEIAAGNGASRKN